MMIFPTRTLGVTLVLCVTSVAYAGDPCPIGFTLFDVGPPPWLEAKKNALSGMPGPKDPLFEALLSHAKKQQCSDVRRGKIANSALVIGGSADPKNPMLKKRTIYKALFSKGRRFQCKGAAKRLRAFAKLMPDAAVIFIRGRRRVLLTVPGWSSFCVQSKQYQGKLLTEKRISRLWKRVTGRFTKDRHDNP